MQRNTGYFPTESLEPSGNRLFSRSALNEGDLFRGSLKYIFIIVRQNMFVHLQNLFFCKISKFPRRILNCQKYSMNRAYTITVPEWTDTEENPNPTGNE